MGIALKAEDVSIRYITGDFKDIGLKEYTVRRLTGHYHVKEFMAVDGVSFRLEQGDMLGIVGVNGAGKSTLLKAVAGIMEPTRGEITAHGDVVALLELGSGFDGDLTVRENAYLRGAMLGYTREFMDATYDQIIDFAELREFEDRPFKQLSSGMKSRLAFSIASLVQPDILILDEVLSVGDGAFQEKSAKKMREIIDQGATTILVSHSLEQIRELCSKVLWLDHGRQIAFGETQTVCDQYEAFLRGEYHIELLLGGSMKSSQPSDVRQPYKRTFAIRKVKEKIHKDTIIKFASALYCAMLVLIWGQQYCLNTQQSKISIMAFPESGAVTFRGAYVDSVWYSPEEIVLDSSNWLYDGQQVTYTAVDEQELQCVLPMGNDRTLIFNAGPNEGIVDVDVDQKHIEFDLWNDSFVKWGLSYDIPALKVGADLYLISAIVFGVVFALTKLLIVFYTNP